MKLSISLPTPIGNEIRLLAEQTHKNVSWVIQNAWSIARTRLYQDSQEEARRQKKALKKLALLKGVLKKDFADLDSVTLSHQAFYK